MIIWICTDMEGLAGIDRWEQCYHPDDNAPEYLYGRKQLTEEVNAAVAGCFDAGATEVRVIDGHGCNRNRGFLQEKLDPRVKQVWYSSFNPLRMEGLDETVHAVAMIGQHAMAGTLNGFIDHTQVPKEICRYRINGEEHGEIRLHRDADHLGIEELARREADHEVVVPLRRAAIARPHVAQDDMGVGHDADIPIGRPHDESGAGCGSLLAGCAGAPGAAARDVAGMHADDAATDRFLHGGEVDRSLAGGELGRQEQRRADREDPHRRMRPNSFSTSSFGSKAPMSPGTLSTNSR